MHLLTFSTLTKIYRYLWIHLFCYFFSFFSKRSLLNEAKARKMVKLKSAQHYWKWKFELVSTSEWVNGVLCLLPLVVHAGSGAGRRRRRLSGEPSARLPETGTVRRGAHRRGPRGPVAAGRAQNAPAPRCRLFPPGRLPRRQRLVPARPGRRRRRRPAPVARLESGQTQQTRRPSRGSKQADKE